MNQIAAPLERWRMRVVILTMAATVIVSVIAGLQADADIRADIANRESQYFAIRASGALFRQEERANYELATFAALTSERQLNLAMEITALEQDALGKPELAAAARAQALVAADRAERLSTLSVFYTDPLYAPSNPEAEPDLKGFMDDSFAPVHELVSLQNNAADEYQRWSRKSDAYVAVLALQAVALFLFGLAQAANIRMRLIFAIMGVSVEGISLLWAVGAMLQ